MAHWTLGIKADMAKRKDLVRVIVDPRDATRDLWYPAEQAKEMYEAGELIQIQVYKGRWEYAYA